ncbi:MAG TPA: hypothetical protein VIU12_11325, partial [Chryseolinea sp.]
MFRMIRCIYIFLLLLPVVPSFAQCNDWELLFTQPYVSINDIVRDRFDNTYLTGYYVNTEFTLGNVQFPRALDISLRTGILLKFDNTNSLVWAQISQPGADAIFASIEVDANDHPLVGGQYYGAPLLLDGIALPNTGNAGWTAFVSKFTPDGDALWAQSTTGGSLDSQTLEDIEISPNGNIVITGSYLESQVAVAGIPLDIHGGFNAFVAAFEPNGTPLWAKGYGGSDNHYDAIEDLEIDSQNNILIAGTTSSEDMMFDGFHVDPAEFGNFFLVKINSSGTVQWMRNGDPVSAHNGYAVAVDADDNVFIGGEFIYGDATIGGIHLTSNGSRDPFIAKYDPSGTLLQARNFGGENADTLLKMDINSKGDLTVSGYYYSYAFTVDSFTETRSYWGGDIFTITFDKDLVATCATFVTGSAENFTQALTHDRSDNPLLIVYNLWDGTMDFGGDFTLVDTDASIWTVVVGLQPNVPLPPAPLTVDLGEDLLTCAGESVTLRAGLRVNAQFLWSTGSTSSDITVTAPGIYWVEVQWQGQTVRDTVVITQHNKIAIDLGDDQTLCPGNTVSWNLPLYPDATYLWNDGSGSRSKNASVAGVYSVQVSNVCETVSDNMTILSASKPVVILGEDQVVCNGEAVTLRYDALADETLQWSDGSTSPTLAVAHTGTYSLTVSNRCGSGKDEVNVVILDMGQATVPNVVTANGDNKNEYFLLPDALQDCALKIYN